MHSRNIAGRHNNPDLDREILKEGEKENRIESRMTKSLSYFEKAAVYNISRIEQENCPTIAGSGNDRSERRSICCGQLQ